MLRTLIKPLFFAAAVGLAALFYAGLQAAEAPTSTSVVAAILLFALLERTPRRWALAQVASRRPLPVGLPADAGAALRRAWIELRLGRVRQADRVLATLERRFPGHPEIVRTARFARQRGFLLGGGLPHESLCHGIAPEIVRLLYRRRAKPESDDRLLDVVLRIDSDSLQQVLDERREFLERSVRALEDPLDYAHDDAGAILEEAAELSLLFRPAARARQWWTRASPGYSENEGYLVLARRLLTSGLLEEAHRYLERRAGAEGLEPEGEDLRTLARLAYFAHNIQEMGVSPDTLERYRREFLYCLAEPLRLLQWESPLVEPTAERYAEIRRLLRDKTAYVDSVAAAWERRPEELEALVLPLLEIAARARIPRLQALPRFREWWKERRGRFEAGALLCAEGLEAMADDDLDVALERFDAAVAEDPSLFAARFNRIHVLLKRGRLEEAGADIAAQESAHPTMPDVALLRGHWARERRDAPGALAAYKTARRLGLDPFQYHLHSGLAACRGGLRVKGLAHLRRAAHWVDRPAAFLEELSDQAEERGEYGLARDFRQLALDARLRDGEEPSADGGGDDGMPA